jgi:transcriptional regulator with XRE-family HTH domain
VFSRHLKPLNQALAVYILVSCVYTAFAMYDLAHELRILREHRALSLRELAKMSGVSHVAISQIERGERRARPSTIRKLANALGVEPSTLAGGYSRLVVTTDLSERRKWEAAGEWAEYYVSGRIADEVDVDPEVVDEEEKAKLVADQEHSYLKECFMGPLADEEVKAKLLADQWDRFLKGDDTTTLADVLSTWVEFPELEDRYAEALRVVRLKIEGGDPGEIIEAAQLIWRSAQRLEEALQSRVRSFQRLPNHYYERPQSMHRIEALRSSLQEAIEALRELLELYDTALKRLQEAWVVDMRRKERELKDLTQQIDGSVRP